jgi:uncharacterized protein
MPDTGFHEGELLVQERAGVASEARRLTGMLTEPHIGDGMARFVAERDLVFLTAEDDRGHLWTSPIVGPRGFAVADDRTLTIAGTVAADDPLHGLGEGRSVGLLLIDFARRRRLRVNGVVRRHGPDELEIAVEQAFGNCPRYIHPQERAALGSAPADPAHDGTTLRPEHVAQIVAADTFVLGTTHPERGADTSHRGGEPGFVRHVDGDLWWPDYDGNNLFNSLGNLAVNPAASLLFLDAARGTNLQLSGHATLEWAPTGALEADEQTGRRVRFTPEQVRSS